MLVWWSAHLIWSQLSLLAGGHSILSLINDAKIDEADWGSGKRVFYLCPGLDWMNINGKENDQQGKN